VRSGYFFNIAIVRGAVIEPAHAKNPARAAGWVCLSCDHMGNEMFKEALTRDEIARTFS
jgi:hypothetical protein